MKVKTTIFLLALLLFGVCAGNSFAGTTGKITGVVTDVTTGEPLFGVNIIVAGTSLGAASEFDGNYVIMNVPPGVHTLTFSMIGYNQVTVQNVRVNIDLTTTVNAQLQSIAIELGETIIVTAERNIVVRDMTGSLSTMGAEQIESLPVQSVNDMLRLNAGVVESDGRLHIRGGRPGEVAYWVDGISATDVYNGTMGITVENSAIQEMQVISGTFNAEYGQAMSGVVNIITKEGGKKYTGQIKLYGGDYVSSADEFGLYKTLTTDRDPNTGLTRIVSGERENPLENFNPVYNAEMSLSGPVPLLGSDFSFFVNGRYLSDEGYFYGREWYKPTGVTGSGDLVAMNPYERTTIQGKINYQAGAGVRLSYNLFWNDFNKDRNYWGGVSGHDYKYVPNGLPQSSGSGMTHTLMLNHVLSSSTFYELRVSKFYNESKQYMFENPNTAAKYLASVAADTTLGIAAEIFDASTTEGQAHLQQIIAMGGTYTYIVDPNSPVGYISPSVINSPTSYSFMNKGMDMGHTERSTSYWVGKLDFTSQVNKSNQIRAGAEVRLHEMILNSYQIVPATDEDGTELTPFQPAIPDIANINRTNYNEKPTEFSAYIQDKLEFNDIIVNIGLRYDYFNANGYVPVDPSDPNIYSPFKDKHIYSGWVDMPTAYEGGRDKWISDNIATGAFREYTPEERKAFMWNEVDPKMSLSPRLGIAFPITDRGVIHFSYGHFFQIPEFQFLYQNSEFKIASGSGQSVLGNQDLEPQKTVMYEIGLQQQLTEEIGIDVTLFYRDVRNWVGTSPLIDTYIPAVKYSRYENKDYSNVKGITLKVEKRFSDNYSFRADYTFQVAEGTYSNPADAFNDIQSGNAPKLALVPMNWDQRHTLNAQFIWTVADWTFSLIGRYWSGRPYTPSWAVAEATGAAAVSGLVENSSRRPDQKSVDLTISKLFSLGGSFTAEFFVNVYNLLDTRDQTAVYGDTGTADYTTTINPSKVPYNEARVGTIEEYVLQPSWYSAPRQIQVGLVFGF
ncbi:MAG: carboxypeptidase-like regulatory domain-containing protein [bacterium]